MEKPIKCLKCGSSNIWRNFNSEDEHSKIYSVVCKCCGHHWHEHYETYLSSIEEDHGQVRQWCPRCNHWLSCCSIIGVSRVGDNKLEVAQRCPKCDGEWRDLFEIKRIRGGKVV